jgi:hypothetical protein
VRGLANGGRCPPGRAPERPSAEPLHGAEVVLNLLVRVRDILESSAVRYALIGAGAMTVHGVGRSTLDLDLLTTDPRVLNEGIWASLKGQGSKADIRRRR